MSSCNSNRLWPRIRRALRSHVPGLALAVGIAILLRSFVAEAYSIPSESMLPTLEIGDHLLVNRFVYGLTLPLTTHKLTHGREPRRGEVVVFVDPRGTGDDLIKRVVGVAGDTVALRANVLYLNGRPVPRRAVARPCRLELAAAEGGSERVPCAAFEEELDGARYIVLQHADAPPRDFGPVRVPAGQVFVMGDSRDNSNDSRYWGGVPRSHLKGRALFIFYSRGAHDGVRWRRSFSAIR